MLLARRTLARATTGHIRALSTLPSNIAPTKQPAHVENEYVAVTDNIRVDRRLRAFVDIEVLPGTGIAPKHFWSGFDSLVTEMMPRNEALLQKRDDLQALIDDWHVNGSTKDESQAAFLQRLGYLHPAPEPFSIRSANVDAEIATVAGPQLVCPVDNARFLLNAANARWGSLLDAVYGTDALLPAPPKGPYDANRGAEVYAAVDGLLDELFPLAAGSWAHVTSLQVHLGGRGVALRAHTSDSADGGSLSVGLKAPEQFAGYSAVGDGLGEGTAKSTYWSLLLQKNGLHAELVFDGQAAALGEEGGESGARRGFRAGLVDVRLESALSTICDFEDSACTVDAEDKVGAYRNWLGLMKRSLSCDVKGSTRTLAGPRTWRSPDGVGTVVLPGQSLLLARNVGLHMLTDAVVTADGAPVPEHFLDAFVTAASALHDLHGPRGNSQKGSVYIVKPKMHGPEEVQLACDLFSGVEYVLGLPHNTLKMGVMDEERRTSTNLAASIAPAAERLVFVNTGFLDRTADEIHTAMRAGPMKPKGSLKGPWYTSYEANNVETCLARALVGKGQIGKGMWAEPDDMRTMLATKGGQLEAGASTAWVPSPTAATLHALHYLRTSVADTQAGLASARDASDARQAELLDGLLTAPLMEPAEAASLSPADVQRELDDNAQGLLGYVVRWVGMGVGCSKVPNLAGLQLMEDRATLRISSQHIANWLHHGIVSEAQVMETLTRVAAIVDGQNAHAPGYRAFAPAFDGPEWNAALDLVFNGTRAPNGYTEHTLTTWRRERKALDAEAEAKQEAKQERVWKRIAEAKSDDGYVRRGNSMGGAM